MQKIKTYRYPKRNILGDRSIVKAFWVNGTTITIPTNASFVQQSFQFNSIAAIATLLGSTPQLGLIGQQFDNFRVNGIKFKITAWPDQNSLNQPVCIFTVAGRDTGSITGTTNISRIPEMRWGKYRVCGNAGTGAKPSTLTSYYSTRKVWGPDATVKNDIDFTGETNYSQTLTNWTVPTLGPLLQFGAFTMSGVNPTTAINITLKLEATAYVQFWGRQNAPAN